MVSVLLSNAVPDDHFPKQQAWQSWDRSTAKHHLLFELQSRLACVHHLLGSSSIQVCRRLGGNRSLDLLRKLELQSSDR